MEGFSIFIFIYLFTYLYVLCSLVYVLKCCIVSEIMCVSENSIVKILFNIFLLQNALVKVKTPIVKVSLQCHTIKIISYLIYLFVFLLSSPFGFFSVSVFQSFSEFLFSSVLVDTIFGHFMICNCRR